MNQEARTLFTTVSQLMPTAYQRTSFHSLVAAFLDADGCPRPTHAQGKSAASLSRFLNRYDWNARHLIRTVRHEIESRVAQVAQQSRRGRKPVLELLVDGTCLEKTGAFANLEIHQLNDKIGLHLVILYVLVGNERFPWAFRVWRGKGAVSQPLLALKMLAQLPAVWQVWFRVRVLGDAGFGSNEFIQGAHAQGLHVVVGVNCSRKTSDGHVLSSLICRGAKVMFPGCGVPVWLSWFKLQRARSEFVWRYVVSTEPATGETIKRWGKRRWRIEAFFKTMKSRFGLDQFGQRTPRGAYRFLVLGLFAYLLTWWTAVPAGQFEEPDWGPVAHETRDDLLTGLMLQVAQDRVAALKQRLQTQAKT